MLSLHSNNRLTVWVKCILNRQSKSVLVLISSQKCSFELSPYLHIIQTHLDCGCDLTRLVGEMLRPERPTSTISWLYECY